MSPDVVSVSFLGCKNSFKYICSQNSTPDPTRGAYNASPDA